MRIIIRLTVILLAGFLMLVAGCAETSTLFKGNLVAPENVIAIQEQAEGQWATFDLQVDYLSVRKDAVLDVSGEAVLSPHYRMNYGYIANVYIYIFFVDENSRVLQNDMIAKAWTGNPEEVYSFSKSYALPEKTTGFAFGYSGNVSALEDVSSFYELPLTE